MKTKQLAMPVKGTSWTDLIASLEPGEEREFPYTKHPTIRPLISGRIALMYPDRQFETSKGLLDSGIEVLIVKRTV